MIKSQIRDNELKFIVSYVTFNYIMRHTKSFNFFFFFFFLYTVEPQWLEHPWDLENVFEKWVVRATGVNLSAMSESNNDNLGKIFFIFYAIIVC